MLKPIKVNLAVTLFFLLTATVAFNEVCAAGGEAGGGGGDLDPSTKAKIVESTKEAKKFLFENNVFWRIDYDFPWEINNPKHAQLQKIFGDIAKFDRIIGGERWTVKTVFQKTQVFVQDALCPAKDKRHHQASVTKNEIGGRICISAQAFKSTPEAHLKDDLVVILAHEFTHIFSYEEDDAELVEDFFNKNRSEIFGRFDRHWKKHRSKMASELEKDSDSLFFGLGNAFRQSRSEAVSYFREKLEGLRLKLTALQYSVPDPGSHSDLMLDTNVHQSLVQKIAEFSSVLDELKSIPFSEETYGVLKPKQFRLKNLAGEILKKVEIYLGNNYDAQGRYMQVHELDEPDAWARPAVEIIRRSSR